MSLLLLARRIRYLLRASFSQDIAAPLPASLPIDIGGPLTITDTESKLSISGGKLSASGPRSSPLVIDPAARGPAFSRVCGRAVYGIVNRSANDDLRFGWAVFSNGTVNEGFFTSTTNFKAVVNGAGTGNLDAITDGVDYTLLSVARNTGYFHFLQAGASGPFVLAWVQEAGTNATLYPSFTNYKAAATFDNFRVLDLAPLDSRFASDYGLTTYYAAAPDTTNHNVSVPDILVECTFAYNGTVGQVRYRRQGSSDYFAARLETDGSVSLREVVGGSATTRGSVAGVTTSGQSYRVVVIVEGNVHKIYVNNTLRITYTDPSNLFPAAVSIENTSQSGGATNLAVFPRTITLRSDI